MSENLEIEVRKNVATNGRLFCVMLFIMSLMLWLYKPGDNLMYGALLTALSVGLSCISEQLPICNARIALVRIVYGLPIISIAIILFNIFG